MKETIAAVPLWLIQRKLPDTVSLQILDSDQQVLFSSTGKWLHPLLAAEEFLSDPLLDASGLILHDRIAGRAAAALTVRMGFKMVKADLMSKLAESVYMQHGVPYCADTVIERITCQTEDLIDESMDLDDVHAFIKQRASAAGSKGT